jgi:hypothetical protein
MKKILKVFTLLIFLVVISGCGLLSPAKVKMLYPIESEDLYFEDDLIKISFVFYKNKIYYEIENKSISELQINWNNAIFTHSSGKTTSLVCFSPDDVYYYSCYNPFYFSTILPYGKVKAYMIPYDLLDYEYDSYLGGHWSIEGEIYSEYEKGVYDVGIKIPVYVKNLGLTKTYNFIFEIEVM